MKAVPLGRQLMQSIAQWKEQHYNMDPHRTALHMYRYALKGIQRTLQEKEITTESILLASASARQTAAEWL